MTSANKLNLERRRHLRFDPILLEKGNLDFEGRSVLAFVDLDVDKEEFKPHLVGFIIDEGHKGCSIVMVNRGTVEEFVVKDAECHVKVGKLSPVRAKIAWRVDFDELVFKVGFQFLE